MLAKILKSNPSVKELQTSSDLKTSKKSASEAKSSKAETKKSGPETKKAAAETEAMEWSIRLATSGGWNDVPEAAYDLLRRLLDLNPFTRISAEQAMEHEFFEGLKP